MLASSHQESADRIKLSCVFCYFRVQYISLNTWSILPIFVCFFCFPTDIGQFAVVWGWEVGLGVGVGVEWEWIGNNLLWLNPVEVTNAFK
mgnify:CR=1 FL=1